MEKKETGGDGCLISTRTIGVLAKVRQPTGRASSDRFPVEAWNCASVSDTRSARRQPPSPVHQKARANHARAARNVPRAPSPAFAVADPIPVRWLSCQHHAVRGANRQCVTCRLTNLRIKPESPGPSSRIRRGRGCLRGSAWEFLGLKRSSTFHRTLQA